MSATKEKIENFISFLQTGNLEGRLPTLVREVVWSPFQHEKTYMITEEDKEVSELLSEITKGTFDTDRYAIRVEAATGVKLTVIVKKQTENK